MENVLRKFLDKVSVDKRTLITIIIPVIVIIVYSLIFHINLISDLLEINLYFLMSFFLAYIAQTLILSIRDSMITNLDISTTFKARLFGNAVSLIIPGAMGPDLARAVVYTHKKMKIDIAFTLSLFESFFDVIIGAFLYLLIFWVKLSPIDTILILVTLANIIGWSSGLGYAYFSSGRLNKIEQKIFNTKYLKPLTESYMRFKDKLKDKISNTRLMVTSSTLTILGYIIQSLPFHILYRDIFIDLLINQTYLIATLVPIPSSAGVAEIALSAVLPPVYVIQVRVLELVSYSLGFIYMKEIKLETIRKEVKEIWKTS